MPSGFLYRERQAKRKDARRISGVVSIPDYQGIEPTSELRKKIEQEVEKHPR
jgi:hypothetical protein